MAALSSRVGPRGSSNALPQSQTISQGARKIVTFVISLFVAIASFAALSPEAAFLVTLLSSALIYKITSYLPKKFHCPNFSAWFSTNDLGRFGPEARGRFRSTTAPPTSAPRYQPGERPSQVRLTTPAPTPNSHHIPGRRQ